HRRVAPRAVAQRPQPHREAPAAQPARHAVAVAAVVPTAADDEHARPAGVGEALDDGLGDGAARELHEGDAREPQVLDDAAIELPNLRGRGDEPHPSTRSATSTTRSATASTVAASAPSTSTRSTVSVPE